MKVKSSHKELNMKVKSSHEQVHVIKTIHI